jgi:hypothetical protein
MSLQNRIAILERSVNPAPSTRFAWLDWTESGARIDGRSFLRVGDESDERLAVRAIGATRERCPDRTILVVSWMQL